MAMQPATRHCIVCDEDYQGEHCTCGNGKRIESAPILKLVPRANMPNERLVAMLERLLKDAKNGELKHLAVACIWDDERTSWGCTANVSFSKMTGAITLLQYGYIKLNDE